MNRTTLRTLHVFFTRLGLLLIVLFWSSTLISELFLSPQAITLVKQTIAYTMILLAFSMAMTGMTGAKMAGKATHPSIQAKRKRMPFIALIGLFIMIPSAIFLHLRASSGNFDTLFYGVQVLELTFGLVNMTLMALSMKDGMSIRKPKTLAS